MEYKVCILAAGSGTRMAPLTNKINKSLLPVNFKAVLSHIIEKFDVSIEIIIALGHNKETVLDYLEAAHSDRKIKIVEVDNYNGRGSGPGYSLMQCKDFIDCPFIFFASDTIVTEEIPLPTENWLGLGFVENTMQYCTAEINEERITNLYDKTFNNHHHAFIGLAGIFDHEIFFDSLKKNNDMKAGEYQVSNGFSSLIEHNLLPKNFTWFDTGNMKGYLSACKAFSESDYNFDFSKQDEFLYFVSDKVIKFFSDQKIASNRYERSLNLEGLCPTLNYFKNNFYSYSKVNGKVLYDADLKNNFNKLLSWLDSNLWQDIHLSNSEYKKFKKNCFNFYYEKTISRINKYHEKYNLKDKAGIINGHNVPSLKEMFANIDWEKLCEGIPSNFHGDLQFDNILLKDDGSFLLLDWRQDFSGSTEYGDRYYDFAKLNGGMLVSYKLIKKDIFSFERCKDNLKIHQPLPKVLNNSRKEFYKYLVKNELDIKKVNILTSLVFLNMSPMHNEPFDHFIYNLGKLELFNSL